MGFTKLDAGIVFSSIMAESSDVFKIWITMMALCGPDGVAPVSDAALPGICHLPGKTVDKALKKLSSPDPHSRSGKCAGARIKRVDGGYFLVNYKEYRERGYSTSDAAVAKREYRARKSGGEDNVRTKKTMSGHSASASSSASSLKKGGSNIDGRLREGEIQKRVGHSGDVKAGDARAHERNLKAFPDLLGKTERHAKRKEAS